MAPERIVVFETNVPISKLLKAAEAIGFQHFQELSVEAEDDDVPPDAGDGASRERVAALYAGLPSESAVKKFVHLYRNWKANRRQPTGRTAFNQFFEHLIDVRLWGPRDRLTDEDLDMLRALAIHADPQPVLLEVELWPTKRPRDPEPILEAARAMGANLLDRANIVETGFAYQALLLELPSDNAADIIESLRNGALGRADDVYSISAGTSAQAPQMEPVAPVEVRDFAALNATTPIHAVLIDGAAIANHPLLRGGVVVEDLFEHDNLAAVADRRHATAMASIILRGDLRVAGAPLPCRVLNIPLLVDVGGTCRSNPRKLLLDQVHRALRRSLIGDEQGAPSAPDAFVVNLSVGVISRVFARRISGLARLLDWWAAEHGVLFVIAAGNTNEPLVVRDTDALDFEALQPKERAKRTTIAMLDAVTRRALLSPAECVNGLTVGASASSSAPPISRASNLFHPFDGPSELSIISRTGFGARNVLKPDVLAPGGRPRARITPAGADTRLSVLDVFPIEDALLAAAPSSGPLLAGTGPTYGTSPAAATATRTALQVVAGLEGEDGPFPEGLRRAERALLAKALIVQSAAWGSAGQDACDAINERSPAAKWQRQREDAARLFGLGALDQTRAVSSDDHRVTCVAVGSVQPERAVTFVAPLPADLSASPASRRILITLAWFSPVSPWRARLTLARLEADIGGAKSFAHAAAEKLGANKANFGPPPYFARRGSVWSGCYSGNRPVAIGPRDEMTVRVSCFADAVVTDPIRFAIAVTFDTEAGVPIYSGIANRLRPRARAQT